MKSLLVSKPLQTQSSRSQSVNQYLRTPEYSVYCTFTSPLGTVQYSTSLCLPGPNTVEKYTPFMRT
jgi:hypothetical protein